MPISVLRPDVAAKIAAGEVIERPASAAKELIENSLDAGATRISVEITGGGMETLRVLDDGCGIEAAEVELAFRRFATSKVAELADLETIGSLGFRGEALASIAAVSRAVLVTKTRGAPAATRIEVAEGSVEGVSPAGAADGTSITVRGLFSSFPARRKFLASAPAEAGRVRTLVQRYALAYPAVAFELSADGRRSVATSGSGVLLEAVAEVYSAELASQMLAVEGESSGGITVSGLAGLPDAARSRRGGVNIFVNGRWIQPGRLGHAAEQAYAGLLPERRFPVAVLFVSVDPAEVDVNVHPAKVEVRFRGEREVYGQVQRAVRSALSRHAPVPEMDRAAGAPRADAAVSDQTGAMWTSGLARNRAPSPAAWLEAVGGVGDAAAPAAMGAVLPAMRVLGQSQLTYLVAEGPDGIYVIDQHAAHERVLYEEISSAAGNAASQAMLVPAEIDLSELEPELSDALADGAELLAEAGFSVEPFGPTAYRLGAVPAAMGSADPVGGLLEALRAVAGARRPSEKREDLMRSIACHGAVRAGMKMTREEMVELTRLLERCDQPHSCPHGRPTVMHLSEGRLAREFGRS